MKIFSNMKTTSIMAAATIFILFSAPSSAQIPPESYCQLTTHLLTQEISNFQELIPLVKQHKTNRNALNQQEELKKTEFAQKREAIFSSFGIPSNEYGTYMGKNGRAVKKYLNDNPEIKQEIESLSQELNRLREQYETLKGVE